MTMQRLSSDTQQRSPGRPSPRSIRLPGPMWTFLSLIVFLAMMVAVGVVVPHDREQRIESRLTALGAHCESKVVAPNWLRSLVGDRWLSPFRRINVVFFNFYAFKDVQLEDDDLAILAGLSNLERLSLNRTRIGDDALRHLEGLQSLKNLQLVDTDITDEGIEHLAKLTQLETLDLWRTQATNEGLKPLRILPNLRQLRRPDGQFADCRTIDRGGN
jgi:Leucine Rich repeat